MGERLLTGQIVVPYIEKYNDKSIRTIAKIIAREHPNMFSVEKARAAVMYYRGRRGAKLRAKVERKGVYRHIMLPPVVLPPKSRFNPYRLPTQDTVNQMPFVLGHEQLRWFVIADTHLPYHDRKALTAAIDEAKKFGPDGILLDGDIMDCYQESKFCKDPDMRNLNGERKKCRAFLASLRDVFPKARIVYKQGNHEWRHVVYLRDHAEQMAGIEEAHLPILLDLYNQGVEWVGGKRAIHMGHLTILHGHEFSRGNVPINAARYTFTKTKDNTLVGHWHHVSEHGETRVRRDEIIACWSIGCLCQLQPEYMPINNWAHGFAFIERDRGGERFHLMNKKIYGGKVL